MPHSLKLPPYFTEYEDGKHRRYNLLFTVNGGAFAIAKILSGSEDGHVLGSLSLYQLAIGMILFTAIMVADIFQFGYNLRSTVPKDPAEPTTELFGRRGQIVLVLIGALICSGWALSVV